MGPQNNNSPTKVKQDDDEAQEESKSMHDK